MTNLNLSENLFEPNINWKRSHKTSLTCLRNMHVCKSESESWVEVERSLSGESKEVVCFPVLKLKSQSNRFKGRNLSRQSELKIFRNRSWNRQSKSYFFQFWSRSRIGSRVVVGSRICIFSSFGVGVVVEFVLVQKLESESGVGVGRSCNFSTLAIGVILESVQKPDSEPGIEVEFFPIVEWVEHVRELGSESGVGV